MSKFWMAAPFAAFYLLTACATQETRTVTPSGDALAVEDVEELLDDVDQYAGQTVSVMGEVESRYGQRAVSLESGGIFNDQITVIAPSGSPAAERLALAGEDDRLRVKGQVVQMALVDVEREYDWDQAREFEVELEGVKPYLIADEVEIVEVD